MKDKLLTKSFSVTEIENELKRVSYKSKYIKILKSTIYGLIIVLAVAMLVVTLVMPVLEVSESSMKPLLNDGEIVLTLKTKNLKSGDIVAFYQGNKILIKRVVAGSGSFINIEQNGDVYIDGKLFDNDNVTNKMLGDTKLEFPYQVQEGTYFVLSDERDNMIDSRNEDVGLVKKDNIIGKVIFRVWPIKKLGRV